MKERKRLLQILGKEEDISTKTVFVFYPDPYWRCSIEKACWIGWI